jgi:hypothetical protein
MIVVRHMVSVSAQSCILGDLIIREVNVAEVIVAPRN